MHKIIEMIVDVHDDGIAVIRPYIQQYRAVESVRENLLLLAGEIFRKIVLVDVRFPFQHSCTTRVYVCKDATAVIVSEYFSKDLDLWVK